MGFFIITGKREFRLRPQAFRNDFCRHCHEEVLAVRYGSFVFGTLFWIPLLPLGPRRRWLCWECFQPTHSHPGPKRSQRFLMVLALAILITGLASVLPEEAPDTKPILIGLIAAMGLGFIWFLYLGISHRNAPEWKPHLARVEPCQDHQCPLCEAPLHLTAEGAECRLCRVKRL